MPAPNSDQANGEHKQAQIDQLLKEYAKVKAYDPEGMENAKLIFKKGVEFAKTAYDALKGADALIIMTEWDEFREPDFEKVKKLMKKLIVIDGRNIYDPEEMKRLGFKYQGVGR